MQPFLPYGRQTIDADDITSVAHALRSDFLTTGPRVEAFEAAFAEATGARHAVACNSGTAALHLALLAHDIGPGDAVIVPTLTFLATANVVRMTGAEVMFADVGADDGLLNRQTLEDAQRRAQASGLKLRAVMPVHLGGQQCDMAALADALAPDVIVVEDACHSLGAAGAGASEHSAAACFSTHPVKAIATGEGGVVTAGDAGLAERMRRLRSHGMARDPQMFRHRDLALEGDAARPWYYEMQEIGWNYRMPDILCALGISQLKKLAGFHARRREIVALYDRLLAPLSPLVRPVARSPRPHGWHLYAVLIDFAAAGLTRMEAVRALHGRGIGTQVHYIPVHRQPYYVERYGATPLQGADRYYERCLSLPFYPSLQDADVERVAAALADVVGHRASGA